MSSNLVSDVRQLYPFILTQWFQESKTCFSASVHDYISLLFFISERSSTNLAVINTPFYNSTSITGKPITSPPFIISPWIAPPSLYSSHMHLFLSKYAQPSHSFTKPLTPSTQPLKTHTSNYLYSYIFRSETPVVYRIKLFPCCGCLPICISYVL